MRFNFTIDTENEEMCCDEDIAEALKKTANTLIMFGKSEGKVMDRNGNIVGEWKHVQ